MKSLQAEVLLERFGCWLFEMLSPKRRRIRKLENWYYQYEGGNMIFLSLEEGEKLLPAKLKLTYVHNHKVKKIFKRSWLNGNGQPSQKSLYKSWHFNYLQGFRIKKTSKVFQALSCLNKTFFWLEWMSELFCKIEKTPPFLFAEISSIGFCSMEIWDLKLSHIVNTPC